MDPTDAPPRFFKVFVSHFSSDSMLIPISYYDEFPRNLSKTAILQGTGGCVWQVAMKLRHEEVYFEQGWSKFVKDNSLVDGDFLTFVYDGDHTFEVSIYGLDGCKEMRAVAEVTDDEEEDSVLSLSSDDTNTVERSNDKGKTKVEVADDEQDSVSSLNSDDSDSDSDSTSELERANTIPRSKNKEELKEEVVEVESDDKEDSDHSEDKETDTGSKVKMAKTIRRTKNKGKKKKKVEESSDEEDSDSDYVEEFGCLDLEDDSSSDDSSYAPDSEDAATLVKPNLKKKGKSKAVEVVDETGDSSRLVERVKRTREKVQTLIENPEVFLDDPKNIHFETGVKNRVYELLVRAQLVKDYCLRFRDYICYIDPKGKLMAKTAKWKDQRVCIKKWKRICERNKLKKKDRVVCELLRKKDLVYAVKLHIIRGKDLLYHHLHAVD